MASFYDEVEIEDLVFDQELQEYTYPCPCGDKFIITLVIHFSSHFSGGTAKWRRNRSMSQLLTHHSSDL